MKRYILGFFTAAAAAAALWLLHRTFPCPLTALLTPVNGSPWEMGKLLYWPYLPAALVIWRMTPERQGRGGHCLLLAAMPQGVLGRDLMWLDIAIFQIAVLLGFWVSWTVLRRRALAAPLWQVAGGAVLAAVWAAFIVWTFAPPELPLFVDPETGLRGIR